MESKSKQKSTALIAGIVCLVVGCGLMLFSVFTFILYVPLFIASFILSIVAMANGRVGGGIALLIGNILLPVIVFGAMTSFALNEYNKAEQRVEEEQQEETQIRLSYQQHINVYDVNADYYTDYLDERKAGLSFKLKNTGDSTLSSITLTAYFKDRNGNTIYEEDFIPFNSEGIFGDDKPLKPNYIWELDENRYLSAEGVPSEWQVGNIELEITDISFSKE